MQQYKIYTKTGDKGITSLFGGKRIAKDALRVQAYGCVDELNAYIGVCSAYAKTDKKHYQKPIHVINMLLKIQNTLFCIGSLIASESSDVLHIQDKIIAITKKDIDYLEKSIDLLDESLPEIKAFILPTGSILASHVQVARTITRRCERNLVALQHAEHMPEHVLTYMNRLSDFFFTLARYCNIIEGEKDIFWTY